MLLYSFAPLPPSYCFCHKLYVYTLCSHQLRLISIELFSLLNQMVKEKIKQELQTKNRCFFIFYKQKYNLYIYQVLSFTNSLYFFIWIQIAVHFQSFPPERLPLEFLVRWKCHPIASDLIVSYVKSANFLKDHLYVIHHFYCWFQDFLFSLTLTIWLQCISV